MKKKLELKEMDYKPLGLKDKEEVVVKCSGCDKKIAIFLIVNKDEINPLTKERVSTKVKVKCCYCGDYSFVKEVLGHFYHGGYHERGQTLEDVIPRTEVDFKDFDDKGVAIFESRRVNASA